MNVYGEKHIQEQETKLRITTHFNHIGVGASLKVKNEEGTETQFILDQLFSLKKRYTVKDSRGEVFAKLYYKTFSARQQVSVTNLDKEVTVICKLDSVIQFPHMKHEVWIFKEPISLKEAEKGSPERPCDLFIESDTLYLTWKITDNQGNLLCVIKRSTKLELTIRRKVNLTISPGVDQALVSILSSIVFDYLVTLIRSRSRDKKK